MTTHLISFVAIGLVVKVAVVRRQVVGRLVEEAERLVEVRHSVPETLFSRSDSKTIFFLRIIYVRFISIGPILNE